MSALVFARWLLGAGAAPAPPAPQEQPEQSAQPAPEPVAHLFHAVRIAVTMIMLSEKACAPFPCEAAQFCGLVAVASDAAERTPIEQLLVSSGATTCCLRKAFPQLRPAAAATLAAAMCLAPSPCVRVGAAYALYRHASLPGAPGTLLQPAVLDALCAAVSDVGSARAGMTLAPEVTQRLLQACGGADALRCTAVSHAELAARMGKLNIGVAPEDVSASDALTLSKMHVKLLCCATFAALLAQEDTASPSQLALADALQSRGVITHICKLALTTTWAAVRPPIVAKMCADCGTTVAALLLERLCMCARRGMARGGAVLDDALAVALANGSSAAPRTHARGVAAVLLSYVAINTVDVKQRAVRDGALVWLLSVATAEETYSEYVAGRAVACAGNLALAARHAAELEPLVTHVLRVIRAHISNPRATLPLIGGDATNSPLYCAAFAVGQLAYIEDARPLLQQADAQSLIALLLALARRTPKLQPIAEIIEGQVQLLMAQPAMVRLRRDGAAPTMLFPHAVQAPPPQQQQRTCGCCGAAETSHSFKLCGACKGVRYCSVECQTRAWPQHKQACKAARRAHAAE